MPTEPNDFGDIVDLREDGILWMINRVIFHPRGMALAISDDEANLLLFGDGKEVWNYPDRVDEQNLFDSFEAMLNRRRNMADECKRAREEADQREDEGSP